MEAASFYIYNFISKVTSCPSCHSLFIRSESGSGGVAQWLEYLFDMCEALGHQGGKE